VLLSSSSSTRLSSGQLNVVPKITHYAYPTAQSITTDDVQPIEYGGMKDAVQYKNHIEHLPRPPYDAGTWNTEIGTHPTSQAFWP